MKRDRLQLFTDSTMKPSGSTATPILGNIAQKFLTIWESLPSLKAKSFVSMLASRPTSKL